jgi:hypothetical protein
MDDDQAYRALDLLVDADAEARCSRRSSSLRSWLLVRVRRA